MLRILRFFEPGFLGAGVFCAILPVIGVTSGVAQQPKEQAYEAKFECTLLTTGDTCTVTADKPIPAGMRLRVEYVKARIVIPSRVRSPFAFSMDLGDPNASGGVRTVQVTPKQAGATEGRFFNIWAVDEKLSDIAYRTDKCPAPGFRLGGRG